MVYCRYKSREEKKKERKRKKMNDYNSNAVDKVRQDGIAKVFMLSRQAMQAEMARVRMQSWRDRVGPLIGLSKK